MSTPSVNIINITYNSTNFSTINYGNNLFFAVPVGNLDSVRYNLTADFTFYYEYDLYDEDPEQEEWKGIWFYSRAVAETLNGDFNNDLDDFNDGIGDADSRTFSEGMQYALVKVPEGYFDESTRNPEIKIYLEGYAENPSPQITVNIEGTNLTEMDRSYIYSSFFSSSTYSSDYLTLAKFQENGSKMKATFFDNDWRRYMWQADANHHTPRYRDCECFVTSRLYYYPQGLHSIGLKPKGKFLYEDEPDSEWGPSDDFYVYHFGKETLENVTVFANVEITIVVDSISTQINSAKDFWLMRFGRFMDFEITNDINMTGFNPSSLGVFSDLEEVAEVDKFTTPEKMFTGNIEGNNHTIFGLDAPFMYEYGKINDSADPIVCRDLNIELTDYDFGDNEGGAFLTSTDYEAAVLIENCSVKGTVRGSNELAGFIHKLTDGSLIKNCHSEVDVIGYGSEVVAGFCVSWQTPYVAENITHDGYIENTSSACGLIMYSWAGLKNCYHKGNIYVDGTNSEYGLNVSGLTGSSGNIAQNEGSNFDIINCFVEGNITCRSPVKYSWTNGLVSTGAGSNGLIKNCYFKGNILADGTVVGLANSYEGDIEDCYIEGILESINDNVCAIARLANGNIENTFVKKGTVIKYNEADTSGFVKNLRGGTIKNCYSRADMVSTDNTIGSGFVYTGTGDLINCYYKNSGKNDDIVTPVYGIARTLYSPTAINTMYEQNDSVISSDQSIGYGVAKNQITPYFDQGNKPGIGATWGRYWKRIDPVEESVNEWENEKWYESDMKVKIDANYFRCISSHFSLENGVFYNWDFENIWGINSEVNNGLPTQEFTGVNFEYLNRGEVNSLINFNITNLNFLLNFLFKNKTDFISVLKLWFPIVRTNMVDRGDDKLNVSGTLIDPAQYSEELWNRKISGFFEWVPERFEFEDLSLNRTGLTKLPYKKVEITQVSVVQDIAGDDTEIFVEEIPSELQISDDGYKYLNITDGDKTEKIGYSLTEQRTVDGSTVYVIGEVDRGILGSDIYSFSGNNITVYKTNLLMSLTWDDSIMPVAKRTKYKYRAGVKVDTELSTTGEAKTFTFYGGERLSDIDESQPFEGIDRGEMFVDARDLETEDQLMDRAKLKFEEMEFETWNLEEFKQWTWNEFKGTNTPQFSTMTLAELIKIAVGITDYTERDLVNNYSREEIEQIIQDKLDVITADEINSWAFDVSKLVARLLTGEPSGAYVDWTEREVKDFLISMLTDEFSYSDFEDKFPFDKWENIMKSRLEININNNASIEVEYNQYGPYNYMVDFQLGDIIVVEYPDVFRAMIRCECQIIFYTFRSLRFYT